MFDDRELRQQICAFAADSGFTGAAPDDLRLLALGGSDRRFYRVPAGEYVVYRHDFTPAR